MERPDWAPPYVEIDEPSLLEWVDYGYRKLESFLLNHARFESYCQSIMAQQYTNEPALD